MRNVYYENDCRQPNCATFMFFTHGTAVEVGAQLLLKSHPTQEYLAVEKSHGISFLYKDQAPEVPFYTVPIVDLFARDSRGGWLGTGADNRDLKDDVLYFRDGVCYAAADSMKEFLSDSNWRARLQPCPQIEVFSSRQEAQEKYTIYMLSQLRRDAE